MTRLQYHSGEEVLVGDLVGFGRGHEPKAEVVVLIPTGEAAPGFVAAEWSYLKDGVMLQTEDMGLVHAPLDDQLMFVARGQNV